jgi:hypothetical protein
MRRMLLVGMACARRCTPQAQPWTKERLQCEETNDQRKGESECSREEVAHAPASLDAEILLIRPATERTVKVHQSRTLKKRPRVFMGPWALIAANWRQLLAEGAGARLLYSLAYGKPIDGGRERPYTEKGSFSTE